MSGVVYILFALCINTGHPFKPTTINSSIKAFSKADLCLKTAELNKNSLQKKCDQVVIECKSRKLDE